MIGWIRDLPDWATGLLMAWGAWFAVSYTVLAPRAMENDLERDVYPACVAELEADQERALIASEQQIRAAAEAERDDKLRQLRVRENELREAQSQLDYYETLRRTYRNSGLGRIMPLPQANLPSAADVAEMRQRIAAARERLGDAIHIEALPRAPSGELLKTCACAAATAVAGKRTNYALSMASFRLVSPMEISTVKQDVARTIRLSSCGKLQWEQF